MFSYLSVVRVVFICRPTVVVNIAQKSWTFGYDSYVLISCSALNENIVSSGVLVPKGKRPL